MKTLILTALILSSLPAMAARVVCDASGSRFIIEGVSANDIRVTYLNETVRADGYLGTDEVDLVARFNSIGEMTLLAKIGKSSPENYVFFSGRKLSVTCR